VCTGTNLCPFSPKQTQFRRRAVELTPIHEDNALHSLLLSCTVMLIVYC
jgi:hypothetical protein